MYINLKNKDSFAAIIEEEASLAALSQRRRGGAIQVSPGRPEPFFGRAAQRQAWFTTRSPTPMYSHGPSRDVVGLNGRAG